MSQMTAAQLREELAEVEDQISGMVGDVAQEDLGADVKGALDQLRQRRLELETRLNALAAGGSAGDTAVVTRPIGSGWGG